MGEMFCLSPKGGREREERGGGGRIKGGKGAPWELGGRVVAVVGGGFMKIHV